MRENRKCTYATHKHRHRHHRHHPYDNVVVRLFVDEIFTFTVYASSLSISATSSVPQITYTIHLFLIFLFGMSNSHRIDIGSQIDGWTISWAEKMKCARSVCGGADVAASIAVIDGTIVSVCRIPAAEVPPKQSNQIKWQTPMWWNWMIRLRER